MSALLAGTLYDPGSSVSKSTTSALAMTAIDTTNLRLTFTAPSNGKVLVRLRGVLHGSTSFPQIFLGVLDGATIKGRQAPIGTLKAGSTANTPQLVVESLFTVTGLTPGNSYTWDAAYGVDVTASSTGLKYGGANDTTTNNAFGGFSFEVWSAPLLLASTLYDPGTAVTQSTTSALAMTALDTTNLRHTFTVPASGNVLVRMRGLVVGSTTPVAILLGVLQSATVKGRQAPIGGMSGGAATTTFITQEAEFVVTGLTPAASLTWDAAYGCEAVTASTSLNYGGPDNTTAGDAYGGFLFEIWEA